MDIYNIIEVANTHGGSLDYTFSLIEEFSDVSADNIGIKFQPFSADGIAYKDYEYYSLYKQLEFTENEWHEIISRATRYYDVWLDMFDEYSVTILKENIDSIKGIKLQSSTLKNYRLRSALKKINLNDKLLIVNVAGYDIEFTKSVIREIEDELSPREIIIQVGFQDYPTAVEDCGLHKILELRNIFRGNICFADHSDGQSDDAVLLPILALEKGCKYIEKHIMHSTLDTKYDAFSSVYVSVIKRILKHQADYIRLHESEYLVEKEKLYLEKTYQMPIAGRDLVSGQQINLYEDLDYKRTAQTGLRVTELEKIIESGHTLKRNVGKGLTLKKQYFGK